MALCSGITESKPPHTEDNLSRAKKCEKINKRNRDRLGLEYLWTADGRVEAARGEQGGWGWAPRRLRRSEEETARAKTLDRRTTGEAAIVLRC